MVNRYFWVISIVIDSDRGHCLAHLKKIVNCTFIIHKTSIQPIRKSNSTSFMINNIFCEMNIKNVTHWGVGGWGKWGTVIISPWKCNYQYLLQFSTFPYLISTLVCILLNNNWLLMCNYKFFYNTCLYKPLSWKVMFPVTSKPTSHTVLNLQASDWVHCEEETGAHSQFTRQTYKLLSFFLYLYSCSFSSQKNTLISNHSITFIIHHNLKKVNWAYLYIY